jgi:hypothetical protein
MPRRGLQPRVAKSKVGWLGGAAGARLPRTDVLPVRSDTRAFDLDAAEWDRYLGAITADGHGVLASITLEAPDRARTDRGGIEGWSLRAIRYERRTDEIEVDVGPPASQAAGLRYFVASPRSIRVQERGEERTIAVDDASGVRTMIRLSHEPAAVSRRSRRGAV